MLLRMRTLSLWILFCSAILGSVACHDDKDDEPTHQPGRAAARTVEQVAPPFDISAPPGDATKTASGIVYKKLVTSDGGAQPTQSDTAVIHYTGWRQRSGETFFSTQGSGQPIAVDLSRAAPGFSEALPLLRKGETAVVWIPAGRGAPEPVVYQIQVVDVVAPAAVAKRAPAVEAAPPR
jgi:hypothetical protein